MKDVIRKHPRMHTELTTYFWLPETMYNFDFQDKMIETMCLKSVLADINRLTNTLQDQSQFIFRL